MLIECKCLKYNSAQTDRIVSGLNTHAELTKKLIHDIETEHLNQQALKPRISEIESNIKKLKKVI